jgi:hypothetical protein
MRLIISNVQIDQFLSMLPDSEDWPTNSCQRDGLGRCKEDLKTVAEVLAGVGLLIHGNASGEAIELETQEHLLQKHAC